MIGPCKMISAMSNFKQLHQHNGPQNRLMYNVLGLGTVMVNTALLLYIPTYVLTKLSKLWFYTSPFVWVHCQDDIHTHT